MNYKSGDLVKITGNSNGHQFKIGETVRLKYRIENLWAAEYLNGHDWWNVRESDMAPVKPAIMPQKIVITTDGKTTLARLFDGKTMVKRAEAKCSPSDTFDFGVGAELAVKRLMGAKPDIVNPITEPIKESEPVKLYCFKGIDSGLHLTKGKMYEFNGCGVTYDDGFCAETRKSFEQWKNENREYAACLAPLVRRPAKIGEWVYVLDHGTGRYEEKRIYKVFDTGSDSCVWFADDYKGNIRKENYLVLSGYTGDPA